MHLLLFHDDFKLSTELLKILCRSGWVLGIWCVQDDELKSSRNTAKSEKDMKHTHTKFEVSSS